MKKVLFLIAIAVMIFATLCGQNSASLKGDSAFVPLAVLTTNVRLRTTPVIDPENILGMVNPDALLIAEKWTTHDQEANMSWYRVVGFLNPETGSISNRNNDGITAPCYISAGFVEVKTYSEIEQNEEFVMQQLGQTPYGQGYSTVDASPDMQRKMAEQKILKNAYPKVYNKTRIPVYAGPSKSSGELKSTEFISENFYDYDIVVADTTKPGWLLIADVSSRCLSGWVETNFLTSDYSYKGIFEVGQLVTLNLGANVPDIMRRWGPGQVVERRASYGSDRTEMSFDGLTIEYENYRNFSFTLTRKGVGMGGIFVGVPWCNKQYIEKNFGEALSIEKDTDVKGNEYWTLGFAPDGWGFHFLLFFDKQGLVTKFQYNCYDIDLN